MSLADLLRIIGNQAYGKTDEPLVAAASEVFDIVGPGPIEATTDTGETIVFNDPKLTCVYAGKKREKVVIFKLPKPE